MRELYGLVARMQEAEIRQQAAARVAENGRPKPPRSPSRHRLAERMRRVADRLDS